MPKERSHWWLARRVAARLAPGPLADAVLGFEEYLYAGAVAHDSAYYVLGDADAKAAADRLHGTGGHDSFAPFRALAARRRSLGGEGLAFGLGALTHLAADATFHPLVFHWTGDETAAEPAVREGWLYRHQAMETALDLHLEALGPAAPARTYGSLARKAGRNLAPVMGAWAGRDPRRWIAAHRRLQGLFHRRWAAVLARWMAWDHRAQDGDWSAAFYWSRPRRDRRLEGTLTWINPVTGRPDAATLDELIVRFEALALTLAVEWEHSWTAGTEPFAGRVGPALDTGVPCNQSQVKTHFRVEWV